MTDLSSFGVLSTARKPRVAVLVDGDNFPFAELNGLEALAASIGEVVIRRVFGDVKKVGGWPEAATYQMLHCDSSCGKKNLADMQLTVAALDLAHRGLATGFVIASDDRDFQPVIQFLIESGQTVLRLRKPMSTELPQPERPAAATPVQKKATLSVVDQELQTVLAGHPKGLTLVAIGAKVRNGTVMAQTGKKTWRAYFESNTGRYVIEGTGAATLVRLKHP
jgi:NYN domain